ncbi:uncharacterized protein KY384_003828 [Bacidia gigantensis]|uniref:uncharacterized protein n=1 Tax=Bacidia gigantensis TaxID=2732470 RepID=UPI001D03AA39|nr:uncharacterized protein KY384_003828 [Bacidia gigantensis]KAG8532187.1 hypothetical protein KY384_003828 [Bacidia gigantensis]
MAHASGVQKDLIRVALDEDVQTLLDCQTRSPIGLLCPRSQKILSALHKDLTVQLFAERRCYRYDAKSSHLDKKPIGRSERLKTPQNLCLYAVLYGSSALFENVGAFVARCNIFLQDPRHCILDVLYRNPQCLSPKNGEILRTRDLEHGVGLDTSINNVNPNDLFAELAEQDDLVEAMVPSVLSTGLRRHQKQALTFMMHREQGWDFKQKYKDLWQENKDIHGRFSYQNRVTGREQARPPDQFRGGLLIDAPGLGKSLSIISLIASDKLDDPNHGPTTSKVKVHPPLQKPSNLLAHIIREPSKSFAQSTCDLKADRRWAVTGTPIQNRLMDLFSLFKFLQCHPFDNREVFAAQVEQSWKTMSDPVSIAKLKTLVNCLSLRRPKDIIQLLPRKDQTSYLDFSELEREDYNKVRDQVRLHIHAPTPGDGSAVFLSTLHWLNELRLLCNHGKRPSLEAPDLPPTEAPWSQVVAQTRFDQLRGAGLARCFSPQCDVSFSASIVDEGDEKHDEDPWITKSFEVFCSTCRDANSQQQCELYRLCNHDPRRILKDQGQPVSLKQHEQAFSSSIPLLPTKVLRLIQDLLQTQKETKSVVFSFWTKTLDLIQPLLQAKSIRCVRLDGSKSAAQRANVLRVFRSNKDIQVLLATISCGGVGLDLTAASRAYIMEPQWNPMSESQALDRIYRLGQTKEVMTVRYIIRNSYEEMVLKLQHKKKDLADLTINTRKVNKGELTYQRLQWLRELVG